MSTRPPEAARLAGAPPTRRRARRVGAAAVLLILAASAGFAVRSLRPGAARPASAAAVVPVSTATVIRTDISARQVVSGTLGYQGSFSVVNELPAGIITWLPAAGHVVRRGQALYQLAGQPVTLLYGLVPAWRAFGPGMTPGPDVRELQQNLAALGFDPWHQITASGQFGWATEVAIDRWQLARGLAETGTVPLGEITFLPGPLRVAAAAATTGTPAGPASAVLIGTSDTPSVAVSLAVGGPVVQPGNAVTVTMPDGTTTVPGTVTAVGQVVTAQNPAAQNAAAQNPAAQNPAAQNPAVQGTASTQAVIPVTIRIAGSRAGLDQAPVQVAITEHEQPNVLAVPVTALLAQPGGGYAVRTAAGLASRIIPVTTGLFDDATGLVEVTGPDLAAGLKVEVAQG